MATLKATKREGQGKYDAFAIRKQGSIPGIVYGKGMQDNLKIVLNLKEFLAVLHHGGRIIDLQIDGTSRHVLVKAVQHGTFDHQVLHADFRAISENEVIEVELEVTLAGDAAGVAVGGMLEQSLHQVTARCLPKDLPEKVVLDVTSMNIGDIVYVADLPKLPGVEYVVHGNPPVVSCHHPRGVEEPAPAAEEGAEPAAPEVIGEKEREAKAKDKEDGKK